MKTRRLEKGEVITIIVFNIISVILFILSIQMFFEDPSLSSQAAFPLLISLLMVIVSAIMLVELRKYSGSFSEKLSVLQKIKETYSFLFPSKILYILILVVLYAIFLRIVGFKISTFLYLFISMILLKKDDIKKSLLVSIGIVIFILILFQYIFGVVLP